jgi:hypothetical protein
MNPAVALLIASLSCQDPALSFREFYAKINPGLGTAEHWMGRNYEDTTTVIVRELDAAADFLDYRAARMEKCR